MYLWKVPFSIVQIAIALAQGARTEQNGVCGRSNAQFITISQPEATDPGHPVCIASENGEQKSLKGLSLNHEVLKATGSRMAPISPLDPPLSDWNKALLHPNRPDRRPATANWTRETHLEKVESWRTRKIDRSEFVIVKTLQQDRMHVVTHPDFKVPVLIKIETSSSRSPSLEREASIYQLLHGSGIAPEFHGFVNDGGRVVGFIAEYVQEMPPSTTRIRSMHNCLSALRSLHQRGVAHGDAHDGNCLIREDGLAVLVDFELSELTDLPEEFERDLDIMSRCIWSISEPTSRCPTFGKAVSRAWTTGIT